MHALLAEHGRETTSFQTLERGLRYWFDSDDACVAYADTGRAWVAAGGPIAPEPRRVEVVRDFAAAARAARRRVALFGIERLTDVPAEFRRVHLGLQPVWDPARWPDKLARKRRLREQLNRARNKGVTVRAPAAEELVGGSTLRAAIDALAVRWLASRRMAAMTFVVRVDLDALPAERRVWVAARDGKLVAALLAVPVYARSGWLLEDALRDPTAPNGTVELLFDRALRDLLAEGAARVTFGLAPLADTPSRPLRLVRRLLRGLFDFEGLHRFKAKLQPDSWEPVWLVHPPRGGAMRAVLDALTAFAGGSLVGFGWRTLQHRAPEVVRLLGLLLIPWTFLLAAVRREPWFPSEPVRWSWVGFDIVLATLLLLLARRWRPALATALAVAAGIDALLGALQVIVWNGARVRSLADAAVIAIALAAPPFAAVFLASVRRWSRTAGLHVSAARPST